MPVAAVFEGDYPTSRAVQAILEARGFEVVAFSERPVDIVSTVKSVRAQLVVLELAMAGARGLQLVRDIAEGAPGCAVVLLSPFDALREPALAAGAYDLVGSDLRRLAACLQLPEGMTSTATVSDSADLRPARP